MFYLKTIKKDFVQKNKQNNNGSISKTVETKITQLHQPIFKMR